MPVINKNNIQLACEYLANTLISKNHDYGNSVEEQYKEYGDTSLTIRIDDKLRRLKQLQKSPAKVNEKEQETYLDAAGYAILAYIIKLAENERPDMNFDTHKYFDQDDQH